MSAIQVHYKTPGSNDTQLMAVQEGLTVDEFVTDILGMSTSDNEIRLNGCSADLDSELQADDVIAITPKKLKSGTRTFKIVIA